MTRDLFEGWRGQYRRMLRWRDRVTQAEANGNADDVYDFVYAFFQSCYHLRDWIRTCDAALTDSLRALFDSSTELQLCRDICNATKHLKYDRPSIDPAPRIGREYDPWTGGATELYVYSDERRSVGQLMHDCIRAWELFLSTNRLDPIGDGLHP